jgi:hypothetical protein
MGAPNPLVQCFWEKLSPRAESVVHSQAQTVYERLRTAGSWGPGDGELACAVWRRALRAAGIAVSLVRGSYYPTAGAGLADWPASSEHVWLLVEGAIFDPAAGGLRHPIRPDYYRVGPPTRRTG